MKVSALAVTASMVMLCLCVSSAPADAAVEGWEDAIMIQANLDYTQAETLRVDDQGNALVVWEQPEGNTSHEALWARQYNRVLGWAEPEKIYDGEFWWGYTEMDMAPNGRAVAAWATYSYVTSTLVVHARMFDPVSGWGQTFDVATGVVSLGDLEVAINSDGDAVCIWSGTELLSASIYGTGTGWSAPTAIGTGGSDLVAGIDGDGNALLIWTAGDMNAINAVRYVPEEGWGAVMAVSGALGGFRATMDMDDSGNAMAVWITYDGTAHSIFASTYSPGTGWAAPTEIGPAEDGRYPSGLDVSAGREGEYLVVWEQLSPDWVISVWTSRYTASAGWEDPLRLSGEGQTYVAMWPGISANDDGQAVAVWTQGGDAPPMDVRVSRYIPGIGWTTPAAIDNSDTLNAFFGSAEMDPLGNIVATWKLDYGQCWLWGAAYKAYSAPDVMISAPLDGTVTTEPTVTVTGYAETYADLTVNGVPVGIQLDGSFEVQVQLSPGDNLVVARATDGVGSYTETSVTLTFAGASTGDPVAAMDITPLKNWKVWRFDGRGSTDDVKVVMFLWDFGDGMSSESAVSSHRYERAGIYLVTLTVWDGDGNYDSVSSEMLVSPGGS